jgi:hypothetical protein
MEAQSDVHAPQFIGKSRFTPRGALNTASSTASTMGLRLSAWNASVLDEISTDPDPSRRRLGGPEPLQQRLQQPS